MNKNIFAICAFIEGLRSLEHWQDSEIKQALLRQKTMLDLPNLDLEKMSPGFSERFMSYADPLGRKISLFEWSCAFEWMERHVAIDKFEQTGADNIQVSTIWMGSNHAWSGGLSIFETMIFGIKDDDQLDDYQDRYATLEQAEAGHKAAVSLVLEYLAKKNPNLIKDILG